MDEDSIVEFSKSFQQAIRDGRLWPEAMPKVIVTDDFMLVDGNHRISGAQRAGFSEVLAVIVPQWTWDNWESRISERRKREEGVDFDGYIAWLAKRSDLIAREIDDQ